jgi:hypothetical protein
MLSERRRPAFTADLLLRVGLVWLLVAVIFVAVKWPAIAALQLPDADDSLRLVQLRDLIAGQGWFDLHQYRIDPVNGGVLMHWSRLVDAPLWLVQSALSPLLGPALAERATLVIVPLITLAAALLLVGRLAWRLLGEEAVFWACLVFVLSSAVAGQIQPLRIDHHGWQIVCLLAALNGLAARNERTGGRIAGIALGLGMTISLELLPVAALFGAVLALRWIRDPKAKALCLHLLRALALTGIAAFAATRGWVDLANHCDTLSPAYLAGLSVAALGMTLLSLAGNVPRPALVLGMGACAAAALAAVLALAPQCSSGPFVALDPLVQQYWYANIREGMPVWRQDFAVMLKLMVPPLAGFWAALLLWQRSAGWLARFWGEYALIAIGTLLLALAVSRSAAFAAALGAVPLGWMLRDWRRKVQNLPRPGRRIAVLAASALILIPDLPLAAARLISPARAAAKGSAQQVCDISAAAPSLGKLAPATIFAPIDNGPMLLLHSRHSVVATAHHRAATALHDTIAAFLADPGTAEAIVRRHGAHYVAICPGLAEAEIYRQAAPHGLMAQLTKREAPAWLAPVPTPQSSGLMLWEVLLPDQAGTKTIASPFMQ